MLIHMVHEDDIKQIKEDFQKIDEDSNGFIDQQELERAFKMSGLKKFNVSNIIQEVDINGNGQINYTEFIAATLSQTCLLSDDKIRSVFDKIDSDKNESLTRDELVEALTRNGVPLTQEELDLIISEHDIDKDGNISFEEFKQMLYS